MTNSEKLCADLGKLYFFKEMTKSELIYVNSNNEEIELADVILRVGNFILLIQIKEKNVIENNDIKKWLNNKVYKTAKSQIKKRYNDLFENLEFKNKINNDILDNINNCVIIPIIIFDVGNINDDYKKTDYSNSINKTIHIFNYKDFEELCNRLISPMEIINFLFEREEYVKYNLLQLEKDNQLLLVKNKNEMCMIEFYIKKYDLIMNKEVIEKLSRFNGYLTLLEEHCIKNKEVYKEFIKIMSTFNVRKIFLFIERLDLIIQKGFNKEIYYNSFIIDEINNVLFFSITKEKYELDFIKFIGTLFMCKYNLLDLLIVISFAIDESNYELDFFIISYDVDDLEFYKKEYNNYYEELWNNKIIDKV